MNWGRLVGGTLLTLGAIGCAANPRVAEPAPPLTENQSAQSADASSAALQAQAVTGARIESISTRTENNSTLVTIQSDRPLSYTSYDPDATTKATQVKFGAGVKMEVKREFRLFELASKAHLPLEREKLKIDSDKAIEVATSEPLLKNLKVLSTRLTLERWEEMPVWKVRLWAAKLRNPTKDADIGEVIISAETGKMLKNDLKISRVD